MATVTDTPTVKRTKQVRKQLQKGEVLCEYCIAKCCKYFALPIDTPDSREDFDFIRWYLLHDAATVFTEEKDWYLLVHTDCKHLGDDNMCQIYETRPQICRDYSTENCEFEDDNTYDRYFETAEQVEEYMEAVLPRKGGIRSKKPPLLPVIG